MEPSRVISFHLRYPGLVLVALSCLHWFSMACSSAAPMQLENANKPTIEVEAVFTEFDRLSPAGIWLKPIVRIELANWSDGVNKYPTKFDRSGLLIQETSDSVTIWNRNLESVQFAKSPCEETDFPYVISITTVSLADQVRQFNKTIAQEDPIGTMTLRRSTFESFEAMFWARVAHAQDQFAVRDALVTTARTSLDRTPLAYLIEEFLPLQIHWYIMRDWEQRNVPHSTILSKVDEYVQRFPKSPILKEATEFREQLRSITSEEAKQFARNSTTERTQEEIVHDLIFRLNAVDYGDFLSLRSATSRLDSVENASQQGPLIQLYRMGFDAVPQLIEAIGDRRPTKINVSHRHYHFNPQFMTIGDSAEAVLIWNSGKFGDIRELSIEDRQAAFRDWYSEVQRVGRKAYLLDAVAQGGENAIDHAIMLVNMYPEVALEPVKQAIQRTAEASKRTDLYRAVNKIGDQATEFLVEQLTKEKDLDTQVAIAELLGDKKGGIGFDFVLRRFKEYCDLDINKDSKFYSERMYEHNLYVLGIYLANSNRLEAFTALEESFEKLPVEDRETIISSIFRNKAEIPKSFLPVVEKLLMKGLLDEGARAFKHSDRVCETAAKALSRFFPEQYRIHQGNTPHRFEQDRKAAIRAYRIRNNLPLLPTAKSLAISPLSEEDVAPRIKLYLKSDDSALLDATQQLYRMGLGAYPAIDKALQQEMHSPGNRERLQGMLHRLSQVVGSVQVSDEVRSEHPEFARQLEKLLGSQLTAPMVEKLIGEISGAAWRTERVEIEFCNCQPELGYVLKASYNGESKQPKSLTSYYFQVVGNESRLMLGQYSLENFLRLLKESMETPGRFPLHVSVTFSER